MVLIPRGRTEFCTSKQTCRGPKTLATKAEYLIRIARSARIAGGAFQPRSRISAAGTPLHHRGIAVSAGNATSVHPAIGTSVFGHGVCPESRAPVLEARRPFWSRSTTEVADRALFLRASTIIMKRLRLSSSKGDPIVFGPDVHVIQYSTRK